ncbi:hypothetical protein EIP86_008317 [Pleurotus ostreatoroseus]|nr:hypothetical protein EIP86_008317 [Pleurotus ostreatoroseus]
MSPFAPLANVAATLAENIVVSLLSNIRYGRLTIHTSSATYDLPPSQIQEDLLEDRTSRELAASIHVRNVNFFLRVLLSGDLGFAESYMFGEVDIDPEDLVRLFLIVIRNRDAVSSLERSPLTKIFEIPKRVLARVASPLTQLVALTATGISNILADAQANISAHYDLGNDMFQGFLSKDMTYSCAIFSTLDADLNTPSSNLLLHTPSKDGEEEINTGASSPTVLDSDDEDQGKSEDELYDAQMRKLRHIMHKADIRPGQRVLEIGSGWGSLSLMITQTIPGAVVDTLTLSTQQAEYVRARIEELSSVDEHADCVKDMSLADRLRVHLMDYRSMPPEWKGAFDRVVSVEMVEAVGQEYLETYFAAIDWALKKDNGVAVVQGITIPEARYEEYVKRQDFIQKWGRLVVDSISNIGPHYARTLREWRRNFEAGFGRGNIIEEALKKAYPDIMNGVEGDAAIEVFKRKWIYYFIYCEAGFTTRIIGGELLNTGALCLE